MSTILIVEDEAAIASFIAKGLESAGFSTETASNGTDGEARATSGAVDLMILDLGLPDIDGFQVLERVRQATPTLPVIILTARSSVPDTDAGLESGADDNMQKHFSFE